MGTPLSRAAAESPVVAFMLMRRQGENRWVGGRRGANVRAKTDLTVTS